jgi:predicted DCC family thiol-disulfide oxidoreductase YuxK
MVDGWILYDGACGICGRWVPWLAPALARVGLGTAPIQSPWVRERTSLETQALLTDLTLLFEDGRIVRGADTYRVAMRRLWWARPLYLLTVTPGLRPLFDRGCRAFARRRYDVSRLCRLDPPS